MQKSDSGVKDGVGDGTHSPDGRQRGDALAAEKETGTHLWVPVGPSTDEAYWPGANGFNDGCGLCAVCGLCGLWPLGGGFSTGCGLCGLWPLGGGFNTGCGLCGLWPLGGGFNAGCGLCGLCGSCTPGGW